MMQYPSPSPPAAAYAQQPGAPPPHQQFSTPARPPAYPQQQQQQPAAWLQQPGAEAGGTRGGPAGGAAAYPSYPPTTGPMAGVGSSYQQRTGGIAMPPPSAVSPQSAYPPPGPPLPSPFPYDATTAATASRPPPMQQSAAAAPHPTGGGLAGESFRTAPGASTWPDGSVPPPQRSAAATMRQQPGPTGADASMYPPHGGPATDTSSLLYAGGGGGAAPTAAAAGTYPGEGSGSSNQLQAGVSSVLPPPVGATGAPGGEPSSSFSQVGFPYSRPGVSGRPGGGSRVAPPGGGAPGMWGSGGWAQPQQRQQQHVHDTVRLSNAPSHFVRASVQRLPHSSSLQQKLHVPLGLVLQPLARVPVGCTVPPTVGLSSSCGVIVRCRRCRTYVNALVRWENGGRRWSCNVCGFVNDTPQFYMSSAAALDYDAATAAAGGRPTHDQDRHQLQHPELTVGSVEFIAPADYMVRPPQPPAYLFLIDVSAPAVASGLVDSACAGIRSALLSGKLPGMCNNTGGAATAPDYYGSGGGVGAAASSQPNRGAGRGVGAEGAATGAGVNGSCNVGKGTPQAAAGGGGSAVAGAASGSRTMVGIITFDSTVHFYYALDNTNNNSNSSAASAEGSTAAETPPKRRLQVLVMPEIEDVFLPLSEGLFVHFEDNRDAILHTLERIPDLWRTNTCVDNCMGSALKAALLTMRHVGGKIVLFTTRLPTIGAFVTQRGATAAAGSGQQQQQQTDREVELLKPVNDVYQQFVVQLTQAQVSVDLFAAPTSIAPVGAMTIGSKALPPQQQQMKTAAGGRGLANTPTGSAATIGGVSGHSNCPPFDLATVLPLAQLTGGEVRFYPGFNKLQHGQRLQQEIVHILTRNTGWEAVMRVRVSRGWKVSARYGRFLLRGADLFVLPCVNEDSTFSVLLHLDESAAGGLPPAGAAGGGGGGRNGGGGGSSSAAAAGGSSTDAVVTVQAALLYTNSDGERRIRVHTFALPVSQSVKDIVTSIDPEVVAYLLAQQAIDVSLKSKVADGRAFLQNSCSQLLGVLQSVSCSSSAAAATGLHHTFTHGHYAGAAGGGGAAFAGGGGAGGGSSSSSAAMAAALVEAGRRIALLVMGLLKGVPFRGAKTVAPDERIYAWSRLQAISVDMLCAYLHPRLLAMHALDGSADGASSATQDTPAVEPEDYLPKSLRLSAEELTQEGAYLLENGEELLFWIGRSISPRWLAGVLGVQTLDYVQPEAASAWLEDSTATTDRTGKSVRDIVQLLRRQRAPDWMNLVVIRQGDPQEHRFFAQLIEDRVPSLLLSFTEFLQRVDVRGLLHTPSLGGAAGAAGPLAYTAAVAAAQQQQQQQVPPSYMAPPSAQQQQPPLPHPLSSSSSLQQQQLPPIMPQPQQQQQLPPSMQQQQHMIPPAQQMMPPQAQQLLHMQQLQQQHQQQPLLMQQQQPPAGTGRF